MSKGVLTTTLWEWWMSLGIARGVWKKLVNLWGMAATEYVHLIRHKSKRLERRSGNVVCLFCEELMENESGILHCSGCDLYEDLSESNSSKGEN
jgi:hypothetical protein